MAIVIELVTEPSTAIDIKPHAVALGGAVTDNTALRIYGDIVANNITTALDKLTSAETLIDTLVDELTRGTQHTATHIVATTAKDWFYTGLSLSTTEAPYGSLVAIGANWASKGISGIAAGTTSTVSGAHRRFAYCSTVNHTLAHLQPVFFTAIGNRTIYIQARSNSAGSSSDTGNTFYIRRILKTHG